MNEDLQILNGIKHYLDKLDAVDVALSTLENTLMIKFENKQFKITVDELPKQGIDEHE